jgi:hypothetical protein
MIANTNGKTTTNGEPPTASRLAIAFARWLGWCFTCDRWLGQDEPELVGQPAWPGFRLWWRVPRMTKWMHNDRLSAPHNKQSDLTSIWTGLHSLPLRPPHDRHPGVSRDSR